LSNYMSGGTMQIFTSLADEQLVSIMNTGAVGSLPSDTVYGIVARAADEKAVQQLYSLKHRRHNPGTIIAATVDQLTQLGVKARYLKAVDQFWPGPISVIVPCGEELRYLHLGKHSLAVRLPQDADLQKLLMKTGPLLTSSANDPGKPPASTLQECQAYFGDDIDFYVDGGDLSGREPSTIIRIVDDAIEVIREGAVKINEAGRIA
jgi:L-threonylcarbamoyladenylate synthase